MSFENGSTSQLPEHNPVTSFSDPDNPSVSAVSGPEVDELLDELGLHDVAAVLERPLASHASPAIETEIEMSDVPGGDAAPHLPEAAESPLLDQLDDLSTTLAALEGGEVAEPRAIAALAAEREALDVERRKLAADRRALEEACAALQQREAEWTARTAEPMTPAESSHAAALQILEAEIVRRTAELNQQRRALEQERAALDEAQSNWRFEYKTQKETLELELQKFTTRQRMIRQEQAEWDKKSAEFTAERTRLREQKQALQQQAAELAAERERVEMQAATILVGARVAEITVNERNNFAAERDAIQAERARFAELQRELDEQRAALEQQQQTLERDRQALAAAQESARATQKEELEALQACLAEAEAAVAEARRQAVESRQLLEQRTAELSRERDAIAEERSRWEACRPVETEPVAVPSDSAQAATDVEAPELSDENVCDETASRECPTAVVAESTVSADGDSADDETDHADATPEERAAAVLRRLGIHPEDQPRQQDVVDLSASNEQASAAETMVDVEPETDVGAASELLDEATLRFARLRAEAMGLAESPLAVAIEAAPIPAELEVPETALVVQDEPLPPPRVAIDKEEAREHLASLREVSHLSAQSALTRHQCKQLRGSIGMRTLIALVSFAGAYLFLSGDLVGHEMFWMHGSVFLVIGIYMAFDAFQKSVQLGIITARRRSERRLFDAKNAPQATGTQHAEVAAS